MKRPPGVAPDALLRSFRVPPECAGMRADVFLMRQLRNTSRTRARRIVETSAYSPDGRRVRPSDRLQAEDQLVLWRPPFESDEPLPPLRILHEDPDLLVVDKPPGVTVHPTARAHRTTIIKRLEAQRPGEWLSLVHRLDKDTSGLLLVARNPDADRAFKRALEDRSLLEMERTAEGRADDQLARSIRRAAARTDGPLEKTYLAITWGVPAPGLVDCPLEIDPASALGVKMRVAARGRGQEARTTVRVVDVRAGRALVECRLHTGRQHQIRVHLRHLGAPVVGDRLYGPDERLHARGADGALTAEDLAVLELPRQALHAHRYRLVHPRSGALLDLVSPLAEDLSAYFSRLPSDRDDQ